MESEEENNTVEFWKTRAEQLQLELDEHVQTSGEIEAELDKELTETSNQLKQLTAKHKKLLNDHESSSEKFQIRLNEAHEKIDKYEADNDELFKVSEFQGQCIRELEQSVDDLERAKRQALATICTLENELANHMEQNAILEADLEEKAKLESECQRLRDQARDLGNDLMVEKKKENTIKKLISQKSPNRLDSPASQANSSVVSSLNQSSERLTVGVVAAATPQQVTPTQIITTPVKRLSQGGHEEEADEQDQEKENQSSPEQVNNRNTKNHSQSLFDSVAAKTPEAKRKNSNPTPPRIINSNNNTTTTLPSYSNNTTTTTTTPIPTKSTHYTPPLHPSTPNNNATGRQSAVSLVGDLLNKIGVLENKLSSCRKFIRDSPWRETHQQHTSMRRSKSEKLPVQHHPPRKIVFQNSLKRSEEKTTTTTTTTTTATTNSEVKD